MNEQKNSDNYSGFQTKFIHLILNNYQYFVMSQEGQDTNSNENEQPLEHYTIIKTLGQGNFGKVKLAVHKITGINVAVKILEKDLIFEKTDIQRISREIKIMKLARHPYVIQLYEIIETSKRLYLIMEYAQNGDLFDEIVKKEQLPQQNAQQLFAQLIVGLQYIHSLGITHRDLKPQNLLLSDYTIKIADFGLGNFFSDGQFLKTACGSPCYAPPQMLNKLAYDPKKVDIWSSGVILHAMVLGYLPFEDENTSKLYQKIKTKDFKLPFRLSSQCKDLIKKLLTKDPSQRIDIRGVKQHEWLADTIAEFQISHQYKIDQKYFDEICTKYGIVQQERLRNGLIKNKHNNLTTLFYLGEKAVKKQHKNKDQMSQRQRSHTNSKSSLKENVTFRNLVQDSDDEKKGNKLSDQMQFEAQDHPKGQKLLSDQLKLQQQKSPFAYYQNEQQSADVLGFSNMIKVDDNKEVQKINQIANFHKKQIQEDDAQDHIETPIETPAKPPKQIHASPKLQKPIVHAKTSPKVEPIQQINYQITSLNLKTIKNQESIPTGNISQNGNKMTYKPPITERAKISPRDTLKTERIKNTNNSSMTARPKPDNNKIQKLMKQKQKKQKIGLKKTERMPIHNPHHSNKPTPALYEHSQSKQRPLLLKKIIVKSVPTQPHLFDPKKIILCTIEQLISQLQQKGTHGKIEYFPFQKKYIYILKLNLHGNKFINSIIKEINEKYK